VIVTAKPVGGVDYGDFTAVTSIAVVGIRWVGEGFIEVEFASDLTPAEVTQVEQRIQSRNPNELTLRLQALTALQNNRADIATNEQWLTNNPTAPAMTRALVEQSTRQARQVIGVIRMLLGELDGTN